MRPFGVATAACDVIMFAMALSVMIRHRDAAVVRWLLFVLVAAAVTVVLNLGNLGLAAQLNGLRQPLFMLSALVVMYDLLFSDRSAFVVVWMDRFLVVFALTQLPLSLYQYLRYGAGDLVGGTYGLGGGSGMLTQLLFMITFYLLVRYGSVDEGESFAVRRIIPFSLLLAPVALNETKISFVFLAVYVGFLVLSRRKFYKAVPILALGFLLAYFLVEMYTESVRDPSRYLTDQDFMERYLIYNAQPGVDVPRFQKLMIMFDGMAKNVSSLILGYGYGLFVGDKILGKTMYVKSFWYTAGTRPMLFSLWMQGGFLAAVGMAGAVFTFASQKFAGAASTVKRFRWFLAAIVGVALLYNEAWLDRPFALIFAYLSTWLILQSYEAREEVSEAEPEASDEVSASSGGMEGELAGIPRLS